MVRKNATVKSRMGSVGYCAEIETRWQVLYGSGTIHRNRVTKAPEKRNEETAIGRVSQRKGIAQVKNS